MCWRKHKKKKKKSEIEKYREFEKWNIYLEETHLISLIIFLMSFLIILISLPLQNLYAVATLSIIFLLSFLIAILALIIKLTLLGVFKQYDIHKIILLNLKDLEKNLENKDMSIKNDKTIMHILFNLKKYRKPQMLNRMSYKMRFQNYFFEKAFYSSHDVDFFENRFVIRKKALQSISQFIKRTILLIDN